MAKAKIVFSTGFGTYRVTKQLGQGGSGTVYEVTDEDGATFAVKVLDPERATRERLKRFRNELSFCLRNRHKNILTIIDHGVVTLKGVEAPFFVMPLFPTTLRSTIGQGIPSHQASNIIAQMLDGVEAAHLKGVWHRDLKPENVLIDPDKDLVVVADWGIAHFSEEELQTLVETAPRTRLASFQYAAPEQRRPGLVVDARADIYALGLIINEIFTGEVIQGSDYRRIADVTPDFAYLDEIVDLMVRQAPDSRPAKIDDVKQLMEARHNIHVSRQKLDSLKETVIPTVEPDDPLIRDPIKLVGVDYREGTLYLKLSQAPNPDWIRVFRVMHYRTAIMGKEPSSFSFRGNEASNTIDPQQAQSLINYFKGYLELANVDYKQDVERRIREEEQERREALRRQIEEEETRKRLLESLNI